MLNINISETTATTSAAADTDSPQHLLVMLLPIQVETSEADGWYL
jgi:hypothetical protein